jgi:hypothetical protein
VNKKLPHVYALPEDDADRQIADGFCLHPGVDTRRIQVMPPVGGWEYVLHKFVDEYISILRRHPDAYVVMIIDFDGRTDERRARFDEEIPTDLKTRVFVPGSKDNPETLKPKLKRGLEAIGYYWPRIAIRGQCRSGIIHNSRTTTGIGSAWIKQSSPFSSQPDPKVGIATDCLGESVRERERSRC